MKLKCPKCGAGKGIGWQTRYQSYSCDSCGLLFYGLEAEVSLGSFFLDDPSKTACPFCWKRIFLWPDQENGGWYGPSHCSFCCQELPEKPEWNWREREQRSAAVARQLARERAAGRS